MIGSLIGFSLMLAVATPAAPAPAGTDSPTSPPIAIDVTNLKHAVAAAPAGFKSLTTSLKPSETGPLATVYTIASLSGAQSCEVEIDHSTGSVPALTCHVYRGGDLIRADDDYVAYAKAFAKATGVAGTDLVTPSRFFIVRTDTFVLRNGVRIVLTNRTRIDPHSRSTDFTIEAPVGRSRAGS